jgi:cysteine desulfurase family protein (TIGR01976 family)
MPSRIQEPTMTLDIDFVRSQYPVFQNPDTAGWAFFENAGGSYVPRQVIDRLTRYFSDTKVQPYGMFPSSVAAGRQMDAGYRCMADFLNADLDELTLGPSTTMNFYVLAQAVRPSLKPGDEIVVTNQDHEANIGCWRRLSEFGALVRQWQIDPVSGELRVGDLARLINERTRLVCFSLCSNIVGTMNDVAAITDLAHAVGALAVGDGVSFAPHRVLDVNTSGLDLYLFSTYKTFGTHVGVMWGKKEVLEALTPQGHYFNADKPHYRMNPAGPLHAEIAALEGIGEYLETLYDRHFGPADIGRHQKARRMFDLFAEHEAHLANRVLQALTDLPGVRIIGQSHAEPGTRAATISLVVQNRKSSDIVGRLVERRLAVRNGHFYALRCLQALGIDDPEHEGVVRISLVHYNSREDVDRLVEGLRAVIC